jgi:hypothetical protein
MLFKNEVSITHGQPQVTRTGRAGVSTLETLMIDNYILTPYPDQAMKGYDLTNGEYTTDTTRKFSKFVM